jgi:hypothetical protein
MPCIHLKYFPASKNREEWDRRENNGEDEPNSTCIYGNVTATPLHNYHLLIKMLKSFMFVVIEVPGNLGFKCVCQS